MELNVIQTANLNFAFDNYFCYYKYFLCELTDSFVICGGNTLTRRNSSPIWTKRKFIFDCKGSFPFQTRNTTSGSTTEPRWTPWGFLMITCPSCTTRLPRLAEAKPPSSPRIPPSFSLVSGSV